MLGHRSFAQQYSKKELVHMSIERVFPDGQNKDKQAKMDDVVEE